MYKIKRTLTIANDILFVTPTFSPTQGSEADK